MRRISPKQLQRQFRTWQLKMPSIWSDIEMYAEQYGILTPTGKVSLRRRNTSNYDAFIEVYKKKFGSYTAYTKKLKSEYRKAKEKGITKATSYKKYQEEKAKWEEVRDTFFKVFVSELKYDRDYVNEEYLYSCSLGREKAIQRLKAEIEAREIFPPEQYINTYGTWKPNW